MSEKKDTVFAFYKAPGDWRDRVIRIATGHPYTHVELLRYGPVAGKGWCVSASKRDGNRVRVKHIEFKPGHWDFLSVPSLDREECWKRALRHLGAPYDAIGAVLTVTPIVTSRPKRWFCSELMGHVADLPQPHTLTPGTLAVRLMDMNAQRMKGV